jgi:protein-disulfide isomerase-like protein with CxxC motif
MSFPRLVTVLSAGLLALGAAACEREKKPDGARAGSKGAARAAEGAPRLELFVMSQCPYGVEVVDAAAKVKKELGSGLALEIQYIGDGKPGSLTSMHGPPEVKGNLAQVCAMNLAPDQALEMITCQNKNMKAVATNWRECATEAGIDADALGACIDGDKGQQLLAASFDEAKKRGADGSPTIFLDGEPYQGGRKSRDFLRAVCGATEGAKPEACQNIPTPPRVSAIFFSDTRCAECNIKPLEAQLKGVLAGIEVSHVDYGTDAGKALYKELTSAGTGFKNLPAVLLGPEVEKDEEGYAELQRFIKPVGEYRELALGGQFDPTAEICTNDKVDDDGNGKADCADPACASEMSCRPSKPKQLDMFVMSQCPYGAKAMIAAKEVVDHFGADLKLNVYFIGDEQGGALQSMHGQPEVDEDIRERCAIEKYKKPAKYMSYLACRSRDYKNAEWQPCAVEAGMDPTAIQACFDGEGKKLLAESFAVAKAMNISSSPTFVVNNTRQFNAIAAGPLAKQFCQDNPKLAGCKAELVTAQPEPAAAAADQQGGQCN